ncbi:hypothetical protein I4F81_001832 [Pyropia yezoensis]|uniref:Uncharacterized protein n=1 Tax=Pyropia yezoensis TaxID=2788 RepID=A0ACC3BNC9_PYRYE|nr:hypothetical protein I4F81_001832 [Neopyropia yezoensis]
MNRTFPLRSSALSPPPSPLPVGPVADGPCRDVDFRPYSPPGAPAAALHTANVPWRIPGEGWAREREWRAGDSRRGRPHWAAAPTAARRANGGGMGVCLVRAACSRRGRRADVASGMGLLWAAVRFAVASSGTARLGGGGGGWVSPRQRLHLRPPPHHRWALHADLAAAAFGRRFPSLRRRWRRRRRRPHPTGPPHRRRPVPASSPPPPAQPPSLPRPPAGIAHSGGGGGRRLAAAPSSWRPAGTHPRWLPRRVGWRAAATTPAPLPATRHRQGGGPPAGVARHRHGGEQMEGGGGGVRRTRDGAPPGGAARVAHPRLPHCAPRAVRARLVFGFFVCTLRLAGAPAAPGGGTGRSAARGRAGGGRRRRYRGMLLGSAGCAARRRRWRRRRRRRRWQRRRRWRWRWRWR